jgi:hypothetical protein
MSKKTAVFLIVLLVSMTAVSSQCFCAPESVSNHLSFQKSHGCCPSDVITHCQAHVSNSCSQPNEKQFVYASIQTSREQSGTFFVLSQTESVARDLELTQFLYLTSFFKPQESLFLKNEVLRI